MTKTVLVGSAVWTNGREHTDEYAVRIRHFLNHVRTRRLCEYASSLRRGLPCTVADEFAVGRFNMVRKLCFEDGVEWVARMRMPPIWVDDEPSLNVAMSSELATMAFVRENTEIRVPQVYGFDLDIDNSVGCPFVLMEYVPGSTAAEVAKFYTGDAESIPAPFREKFWRQVADVMARLAAVRLPKIGCIFRESSNPGAFAVGPLVDTLSGPYDSAAAFYRDWPLQLGRKLRGYGGEEEGEVGGEEELLRAFMRLARSFSDDTNMGGGVEGEEEYRGGFRLVNYDLDPSNVLVDNEFNVLGVIDWDSAMALPDAALHRLPLSMGVDIARPGITETCALQKSRCALGHGFARIVEKQAKEGEEESVFRFTAEGFYMREAVAYRSLIDVQKRDGLVNREWVACLNWLAEHGEEELAKFYEEN